MGWAIGFDDKWKRWVGYGVPAWCDFPGCYEEIDRGLSYVCGAEPYGGEEGCGLHFCEHHRRWFVELEGDECGNNLVCERCRNSKKPFKPSAEKDEWLEHLWTARSWAEWRKEQGLPEPEVYTEDEED